MNRKKAIYSILLLGGGAAATYSGYKWYNISKTPDLAYLNNHKAMIADLAETIIPRTDSPGAKDAMVHETIIMLVRDASDRKTQNNFIDGLKDVHSYSDSRYSKPFTQLSTAEQTAVVKHFEQKGKNYSGFFGKVKNRVLGRSFFNILKEYTTIGFCTSKTGATQALAYDFIPGKYNGCMPLLANQRSWATK